MVAYRKIPAGDLALENGDLVVISGAEYVRQKLAVRFRFFLGEWFLDRREGVPYYRDVFVKSPNLAVIRSLFRAVAMSVPGVASLPRFEIDFHPQERHLLFDFIAKTSFGDAIVVTPADTLFILTV
jgi:hypothetical protein